MSIPDDDRWIPDDEEQGSDNGGGGKGKGKGPRPKSPDPSLPFLRKSLAAILAMPLKDPLRRIDGLIGEGDYLTMVFGPSTSGKTFLVVDLVFALLLGKQWFGRDVLKCGVLYIAREGEIGFYNRLKSYVTHFLDGLADPLPFDVVTMPVNFGPDPNRKDIAASNDSVQRTIATIEEMKREYEIDIGVVVYDNMRAVAPGLHENYADEVAAFFDKTRHIARETGASPIIIQNTGKDTDRGARGTQAQYDLADTVIETKEASDNRSWSVLKTRDAVSGQSYGFRLEQVPLGTVERVDGSDKDISSCIVVQGDTPAKTKTGRPNKNLAAGLRVLSNLIAEHGVENQPLGPNTPTVFTVEKEAHLRPAFYKQAGHLDTDKTRAQALRRVLEDGKLAGLLNSQRLADGRVLVWRT